MIRDTSQHPSEERLQAFLEGELPDRERREVEEHAAACPRCTAELDAWRVLFDDLGALPRVAPAPSFAERVLAEVRVKEPATLAARARARLAALLPSPRPRHVSHDRLQDYVEGLLPARQLASVEAHLASCGACAAEADQWRTLLVRLSTLERLTPREGFAETVLARLSRPQAAPAAAREAAAGADWWQSLVRAGAAAAALVRRAVPRSRRAWAALAGVSVTPAVTLGLVLYTVFSHPSLTPGALVSFVVWKASALLAAGWATFVASASEVVRIAGLGPWVEALAGAPALVAAAVLAYAALFLLATRVLYKNLVSKNLIPGRRRVSVG